MSITAGNDLPLSARGLARLATERGSQLVVLLLIIALGLDAAWILTRALGAGEGTPAAAAQTSNLPFGARSRNPQLLLATVVQARLFGAAPVAATGNAPATSLPLVLTGVFADPIQPSRGQAIIGPSAAAARLYSVGAAISGGAYLHAVYSDRVLLERNGALETLMLPRTPLPGTRYTAPPPAADTLLQSSNASVLAGLLRAQPVFAKGKLAGYRIFPQGPQGPQAFQQLGLRPGDLVIAINGTNLDDPSRAVEILQTLSSSGSAQLTVTRNGTPLEVNVDLAGLSNLTPGAGGGAAAGNPGADTVPGPIGPAIRRPRFGFPTSEEHDIATGGLGL